MAAALAAAIDANSLAIRSEDALDHLFLTEVQLGILPDHEGAVAEYLREPAGKLAVRRALVVLALANPRLLASAMGVAQTTLYAFSDPGRTQTPNAEYLFRAAFAFRLLESEFSVAAEQLLTAARSAQAPSRGRPKKDASRE